MFGVLGSFFVMTYYSGVAGWVWAYVKEAISGNLNANTSEVAFDQLRSNPLRVLVWQWAVLIVLGLIISAGVSRGIEAVTKRLIPVLLLLLIILAIRGLTLPGAKQGLEFLFVPRFDTVTGKTILTAMGLAFFKLSVGMGAMMVYGSYFGKNQPIIATAGRVALADLVISLLAGIAIFPAVFSFGFQPNSGPALLFNTIPAVFDSMPVGGHILMVMFFILTAFAAIGASLSLIEVSVSILGERFGITRKRATVLVILVLAVVGSLPMLSYSILQEYKLWGLNFFDFSDFISEKLFMPISGLLSALFVTRVWGYDRFLTEVSNHGDLKNRALIAKSLLS